ncbi:MAG: phosphate signaling complex protein PhoU [Hyphomicrobiales bacterium]|nr:phosphate signaling complex protein PhoU [Hyphomicrobiales bacterium]OQW80971.1 MAG: phosphate transport system regulatory protein PhoU [Proteobacteria bacterium ST_bin15]
MRKNTVDHTVKAFEDELENLTRLIAEMGGLAEKAVADSVLALGRRDLDLAGIVVRDDVRLDRLQREVEEAAILLIARRQPVASDLRDVVGALRICSDLERIGDLAKNIAKRVIAMGSGVPPQKLVHGVSHISQIALEQLKHVLDAYTQKDQGKALGVWKRDEEIDAMYTSIFRELLTYMMEDARNITACTHLLFTAKNIERIGDHATNIAETVYYVSTGENLSEDRPKGDDSLYTSSIPTAAQ